MYIEIEHTKGFNLFDSAIIAPDKQISLTNFNETDALLAHGPYVKSVIRIKQFHACCYWLR